MTEHTHTANGQQVILLSELLRHSDSWKTEKYRSAAHIGGDCRGPLRRAMDKAFFIFLVLIVTLLMLEAVCKLLWLLPWAKFEDWLLRTPEKEEVLEL
ncbi:small integral membrane protein 40 [Cervus elaphus]|uniref:small integral membrane protein 40 n=1 Tax=Cervus canadensis TaxID=1574408 RepID=UPI001CA34548|nr:small integral membrane protein 40 [Cervus canadensis]XP_043764633.1 small integral membrane protein 40 [Cervus elaphus]